MESFKMKNRVVYDYLKERILSGKIRPGEKITPKDISQQFSISGIPIREAINKLSSEGLITAIPHVGARVANIDKEKVEEIHMIRVELEILATRLACKHITNENLTKLEKIIMDSEQAIQLGKYEKFRELNKQFHIQVYRSTPFQILATMIVDLYEKLQLVPTLPWSEERVRRSLGEHKLILKALVERNEKLATEVLRRQKEARWHAISESVEEIRKKGNPFRRFNYTRTS
jgi:DNA-binding GntR family transcriptional regulator